MSDPLSTSKSARESLARGLNALQADPTVPPALVELAAPIAQAMGALHQLERTQQLTPHAEVALTHLRGALAQLQTAAASTGHPAVNGALDAVAGALSLVHSLSKMANGPQAAPPQQHAPAAQQHAPPQQHAPAPQPAAAGSQPAMRTAAMQERAPTAPQNAAPQGQHFSAQQAPQPAFTGPQPGFIPQNPIHVAPPPAQQHPPQPMPHPHAGPSQPMVSRDPFAAPQTAPQAQAARPSGPQIGPPAAPNQPVPAPPAGGLAPVAADLGAHSATNFFKGLAGNDIIDHGGIFVSTYLLPKIGSPVRIKVSLPGGYEFEANAVVKWTREDGGGDVPPGFGARFTQITPEARQLVYRYVRNREPMFYDDL